MSSQRKTTRRDLPGICVCFAAILALSAVALWVASRLDMATATPSNLQMISGQVELVSHRSGGKAVPKLEILVRGSDGLHHLTQDDLTKDVPALRSLRVGDQITAMARPDKRGRDLDTLWELRRDGAMLLSVEETAQYFERRNLRTLRLASGAAVISVALLTLGVLLRRHFGAWYDTT